MSRSVEARSVQRAPPNAEFFQENCVHFSPEVSSASRFPEPFLPSLMSLFLLIGILRTFYDDKPLISCGYVFEGMLECNQRCFPDK